MFELIMFGVLSADMKGSIDCGSPIQTFQVILSTSALPAGVITADSSSLTAAPCALGRGALEHAASVAMAARLAVASIRRRTVVFIGSLLLRWGGRRTSASVPPGRDRAPSPRAGHCL